MTDSIKCPKCAVDMDRLAIAGVELDRCPTCLGIWFDLLEHEDLRKVPAAELVDLGAPSVETDSEGRILDCPRCHGRMSPTHDLEQPHIVYEKCSVCCGVFFDAGEFTDFKELTLLERLKHWAG